MDIDFVCEKGVEHTEGPECPWCKYNELKKQLDKAMKVVVAARWVVMKPRSWRELIAPLSEMPVASSGSTENYCKESSNEKYVRG